MQFLDPLEATREAAGSSKCEHLRRWTQWLIAVNPCTDLATCFSTSGASIFHTTRLEIEFDTSTDDPQTFQAPVPAGRRHTTSSSSQEENSAATCHFRLCTMVAQHAHICAESHPGCTSLILCSLGHYSLHACRALSGQIPDMTSCGSSLCQKNYSRSNLVRCLFLVVVSLLITAEITGTTPSLNLDMLDRLLMSRLELDPNSMTCVTLRAVPSQSSLISHFPIVTIWNTCPCRLHYLPSRPPSSTSSDAGSD